MHWCFTATWSIDYCLKVQKLVELYVALIDEEIIRSFN